MTASAPALNARVIALAHYAARALLDDAITRHGVTFHQNVTLRAVAVAGDSVGRKELLAEVTGALKAEEPVVLGVIEELTAGGLLEDLPAGPSRLRLTPAGRELHRATSAEGAAIAARLYADIPAEDLAVAGRVLTLITDRANAELAGV